MNSPRNISAIVVNYNGKKFIDECLKSLIHQPSLLEIIVVDNGSVDGSLDYLRKAYPDLILIPAGENIGFGRACNLGASVAQGDYLLLLNYDAELVSGLDEAVNYLNQHRQMGIVGGKLFYPNGRLQPSVGRSFVPARLVASWLSLSRWFPRNPWFSLEIVDPTWYEAPHLSVAWITGALMLIRRLNWEQIGGMDPAFFLYVEDVDLCKRLKLSGSDLGYLPEFMARHRKGGGAEIVSPRALLSTVDSYGIYLSKHYGKSAMRATLAMVGLVFLLRSFVLGCRLWRGHRAWIEAGTYFKASRRAFGASAGEQFPWGPPV